MKLKRIIAIFAAMALSASLTVTSFAADKKEISKDGTKIALDQTDPATGVTDTVADLNMSWEDGKIIFNYVVKDSEIDNTAANSWEKDSVEVRVDSKDEIRIDASTGEASGNASSLYDVDWKITDGGYEITATYNNDAVKAGYEFTFSAQINCATGGVRECTLHFDAAHGQAWTDDSVRTPAVLTGGGEVAAPAAASTDAPAKSDKASADTGVEDVAVVIGIAIVGTSAIFLSRKKK